MVGASAGVVDLYDVSLRRYRISLITDTVVTKRLPNGSFLLSDNGYFCRRYRLRDPKLNTGWEVTVVASNVAIVKSLTSSTVPATATTTTTTREDEDYGGGDGGGGGGGNPKPETRNPNPEPSPQQPETIL